MNKKNKTIGITYQDYKKKRKALFKESKSPASEIEKAGNEEFLIYLGRASVVDFSTGIESRALLKVGRGKFGTAIQRGRNQPGVDFRFYSAIYFNTNEDTWAAEKVFKDIMKSRHAPGPQGQKELYNFKDCEIRQAVQQFKKELSHKGITTKHIEFWC